MRDLDETDLEILQLLMEDARRPFRDIADFVGLSAPAVSDRVTRLQEAGVVRGFTLDIDRSQLREGVSVLIELQVDPAAIDVTREALLATEAVEHVFTTAEAHLVCQCHIPDGDVRQWLAETVDLAVIDEYSVTLLVDAQWTPVVGGTDFAFTCAECGNTVTSNGVTRRLDEEIYHFCCPSCEARFEEQYERIREEADD